MSLQPRPQFALVVVFSSHVEPGIARTALRRRWQILDGRNNSTLTRQVLLAHPRAVVVQVPPQPEPATGLIARLSRHWTPMVILAVASPDANETEAAVRQAGADCFLPGPCDAATLDDTLERLLPGATSGSDGRAEEDTTRGRARGQRIGGVRHAATIGTTRRPRQAPGA